MCFCLSSEKNEVILKSSLGSVIALAWAKSQANTTILVKCGITGHKSDYIVSGMYPALMLVKGRVH